MAFRMFGRSIVGGFSRRVVRDPICTPTRSLIVSVNLESRPEFTSNRFSYYETPSDLNTTYDPKKIRTNFLDCVIRSLDMRYPAQELKKILDNPNVRMFDLVQTSESYQNLITYLHIFDEHPNDVHRRDTGVYRSNYGTTSPTNFIEKDIDELLELLLTHPKSSIHIIDSICSRIDDTYEVKSRREHILRNMFNDPYIGKFVIGRVGEIIYHAAVYSRYPAFTIRAILEQYQLQHESGKYTEDSGLCSLCETNVVNIQAMNVQMAHQHALNTNNVNVQNLLEDHPISANILG